LSVVAALNDVMRQAGQDDSRSAGHGGE
jgi:hypothetical protein